MSTIVQLSNVGQLVRPPDINDYFFLVRWSNVSAVEYWSNKYDFQKEKQIFDQKPKLIYYSTIPEVVICMSDNQTLSVVTLENYIKLKSVNHTSCMVLLATLLLILDYAKALMHRRCVGFAASASSQHNCGYNQLKSK